jgi:hypothetical protein
MMQQRKLIYHGISSLWMLLILIINVSMPLKSNSQGLNHQWLLGYGTFTDTFTTSQKARLLFDTATVTVVPETRKMKFRGAQANIADENGNLLFVSNGIWIADATNDTMLNGGGLNPGTFATAWQNRGMPFPGLMTVQNIFCFIQPVTRHLLTLICHRNFFTV